MDERKIVLLGDKNISFKQQLTGIGFDCEVIMSNTLSDRFFSNYYTGADHEKEHVYRSMSEFEEDFSQNL